VTKLAAIIMEWMKV